MKNKKLTYVFGILLVFASLLLLNQVSAKDGGDDNGRQGRGDMNINGMGMNSAEDNGRGMRGMMQEMEHRDEAHATGSTLEVHISDNGTVLVRGAKVTGISGGVVSASTSWGSINLDWAISSDTSSGAKFFRKFGGTSNLSEISVGDFISFQGTLVTTSASPLTVNANVIKNWSIQKKEANATGTVKSVDTSATSFVLTTEGKGDVTILVTNSTVVKKGGVSAAFSDIVVGAKVGARGVWNNLSNQISATGVMILTEKDNHENTVKCGTIKSISDTTAPTTLVVTINGQDYTVNVVTDTSVLNSLWQKVALSVLVVGNKVQVYGAVNANTIDATVVRDMSI